MKQHAVVHHTNIFLPYVSDTCNNTNLTSRSPTWTFDIHEVRVRALDKSLQLTPSLLLLHRWMQQIFVQLYSKQYVCYLTT